MEDTFSKTVLTEGVRQGYENATQVIDELKKHEMLDSEVEITMPTVKDRGEDGSISRSQLIFMED